MLLSVVTPTADNLLFDQRTCVITRARAHLWASKADIERACQLKRTTKNEQKQSVLFSATGSAVPKLEKKSASVHEISDSEESVDGRSAAEMSSENQRHQAEGDDGKGLKRSSSVTERQTCPYGMKCYRKNSLHFEEMIHPAGISLVSQILILIFAAYKPYNLWKF